MNKLFTTPFILLSLIFSTTVYAEKIILQYENVDSFPFSMKNGEGLDIILLEMVDEKLADVEFEFQQVPWQRCLNNIQSDTAQGCFSASFKEERKEFGVYPEAQAKQNIAKRLHDSSYSLYTLKEKALSVKIEDGLQITGIDGTIASPSGYSISDDLKAKGLTVDATANKSDANFQKLILDRVQYVAALTQNGDAIIAKAEFAGKVVALKPELVKKPYYLMFSKQFHTKKPQIVAKIWDTIEMIRESSEYKEKSNSWINTQK